MSGWMLDLSPQSVNELLRHTRCRFAVGRKVHGNVIVPCYSTPSDDTGGNHSPCNVSTRRREPPRLRCSQR